MRKTQAPTFDLRPVTADLTAALIDLLTEDALRQALYAGVRVPPEDAIEQWTEAVGPRTDRRIAVDTRSGCILGGAKIDVTLMSWFVAPVCQGKGLGTAMVSAIIQTVDPERFAAIEAHIARENVASRRIADRVGFVDVGLVARASGLPPLIVYRQIIDPSR
ncbi:MAG: GNAT family N-acetyltransferase [Pseudomonadota bacterium]